MAQDIIINIPLKTDDPLITINATLIRRKKNLRNNLFICTINNVDPPSAKIPRTSDEASDSLRISIDNSGEEHFRFWRTRLEVNALSIKTYPNNLDMIKDNEINLHL